MSQSTQFACMSMDYGTADARPPFSVTLPTQDDIATALRGLRYPWSGALDDTVALARRRSYSHLLPVGLFPDEETPTGMSDVAGLVWHWIGTPWPDTTTRQLTMVHGGGFGKNVPFFLSDCFLGANPASRRADRRVQSGGRSRSRRRRWGSLMR